VPEVDSPLHDNIIPKVRIYDAANDGSYWFRRVGFLSTISGEN
jgi:hypothetical protein